jgi:hypothetical protein
MNAPASRSAAPGALIDSINGVSLPRWPGSLKLKLEAFSTTGALATR